MPKPSPILSTDTFLAWRTAYNTLLDLAPEVVESISAPTVNDDSANYEIGTIWVHTTVPKAYLLVDGTVGAAVWHVIGVGTLAVGTAELQDNAVTDAKLRDSVALSIIGRAANSTGDPGDIAASSDGQVLRRSGTTLGFGTIATAGIANNAVTLAKLATVSTDRLLGRDTTGTGNVEALTVGGGIEFSGAGGIQRSALSGDVNAPAGSNTTTIPANTVSDAQLRDSAALSVIGRSAGTTGDPGDISAATDGHVLRRSGSTLGFGTIASGALSDGAVTLAKMQTISSDRLLGRDTAATGIVEQIAMGAGLAFSGTGSIQVNLSTGPRVLGRSSGGGAAQELDEATLKAAFNIGSGGLAVTYRTANYTAVAGDFVVINNGGSNRTITLPASMASGDRIAVHGYSATPGITTTVARNGKQFLYQGVAIADDLVLANGETVEIAANGATYWVIV